jgi:hypothetical protein
MPHLCINMAVSHPPLGMVRALLAFPKLPGCEHRQIHVPPMTQQVVVVGDQGGTGGVGQCGKLTIIRVWDKCEPLGMGRGGVAILGTKEVRHGIGPERGDSGPRSRRSSPNAAWLFLPIPLKR